MLKATHIECVKMVPFYFGFWDIKFASHCLCAFINESPLDWTRGHRFHLLLQNQEENKFTVLAIFLLRTEQRMNVIRFTHEVSSGFLLNVSCCLCRGALFSFLFFFFENF